MSSLAIWQQTTSSISPQTVLNASFTIGANAISVGATYSNIGTTIKGDIYYSNDFGITWQSTASSLVNSTNLLSCYMVGQYAISVGINATTIGCIYYSSDYGVTWLQSASSFENSSNFISCCMVGQNAVAVGSVSNTNKGYICYSNNSGVTWTQTVSDLQYTISFSSISMYQNYAIATGSTSSGASIFYSNNYGVTWTQTASSLPSAINIKSCVIIGSYAICCNSTNRVFFSSDYGVTWTSTTISGVVLYNCYMSGNNAVLIGDYGNVLKVYYSTNNGSTFSPSTTTFPTHGIISFDSTKAFIYGTNVIISCTDSIYYSSDYGQTFTLATNIVYPENTVSTTSCWMEGTNCIATFTQTIGNTYSSTIYYSIESSPVVCFNEDTQILTDSGYKLVQDLRKGDLVKTALHGFVPIEMIAKRDFYNPASSERIKDQLYVLTNENYPDVFEPLIITGCHSILVDGFKDDEQREKTIEVLGKIYVTNEKYRLPACVDERCEIYEKKGNCTIYHFALENENYYYNYGIYANGLLVETCSIRYLKELSNMIELV
jgi:photosystem II stability/assembly factor-like uncharacterized protein